MLQKSKVGHGKAKMNKILRKNELQASAVKFMRPNKRWYRVNVDGTIERLKKERRSERKERDIRCRFVALKTTGSFQLRQSRIISHPAFLNRCVPNPFGVGSNSFLLEVRLTHCQPLIPAVYLLTIKRCMMMTDKKNNGDEWGRVFGRKMDCTRALIRLGSSKEAHVLGQVFI